MKKFFALAAVAAMFIACGPKEENKPNGGENNGGNTEEPAFKGAITIDGEYADWAAIEPAVATLPTEGTIKEPSIKTVKAYADEFYVYVYAEYDATDIYVIDLFLDVDNDATTGCVDANKWGANGLDVLMQGAIYNWSEDKTTQLEGVAFDPGAFSFGGEPGSNEWNWVSLVEGGIVTSSVPNAVGNLAAIEFAIMRDMVPVDWGTSVGVGIMMETRGWSAVGKLPALAMESEEAAPMLVVTLP